MLISSSHYKKHVKKRYFSNQDWGNKAIEMRGESANAVPHNINYASEFPTFGEIAEVNSAGMQWSSLALGEPPC